MRDGNLGDSTGRTDGSMGRADAGLVGGEERCTVARRAARFVFGV